MTNKIKQKSRKEKVGKGVKRGNIQNDYKEAAEWNLCLVWTSD